LSTNRYVRDERFPDPQEFPAVSDSPASGKLEVQLHALLANERGITVAAAESCTGGEIAHRITSVAGSSDYFLGSVVAYANSAKESILGVPADVLASVGAVSAETASAMVEGARRIYGADLAVASTGIAGPGGATARKPVGLVYLAVSTSDGVRVEEHHFPGDRSSVVDAAVERALQLLVEAVRDVATSKRTIENQE